MRNLYLTATFLLAVFTMAYGQAHLSANRPTLAYAGPDSVRLNANVQIDNNSSATLNLVAERINKVMTPGHYTYFCWSTCYDTITTLSDPMTMAPNGNNTSFEGWVIPNRISGRDTVYYRFYDNTGASDTLVLRFTYDFGITGIEELGYSKFSFAFNGANPADARTSIVYSVSGAKNPALIIYNMLGSMVKEIKLDPSSQSMILPTSDLPSGNYSCTLVADNVRIGSKKLVVYHQ